MSTIAIDFDETIVEFPRNPSPGARANSTSKPMPGARDAINLLREQGHKIIIHSCNRAAYIEQVLNDNDIRYDSIWTKEGKPVASIYLDDRGLRFYDWEQAVRDIQTIVGGL